MCYYALPDTSLYLHVGHSEFLCRVDQAVGFVQGFESAVLCLKRINLGNWQCRG